MGRGGYVLSSKEGEALEKSFAELGIGRRTLLVTLAQSYEELSACCAKEPEAFFEAFECGVECLARQREFAEVFLIPAARRFMLALCEVDWSTKDAPFSQEAFLNTCRRLDHDVQDVEIHKIRTCTPEEYQPSVARAEVYDLPGLLRAAPEDLENCLEKLSPRDRRLFHALQRETSPGLRQMFYEASQKPELLKQHIALMKIMAAHTKTEQERRVARVARESLEILEEIDAIP